MRIHREFLLATAIVHGLLAWTQVDSFALKYARTITEEDLRRHLTVLASDEFEGRETGYEGQRKAARYLKDAFRSMGVGPVPGIAGEGLIDGYEQEYPLELTVPGELGITISGLPFGFAKDYFYFSDRLSEELGVRELVWNGYGLNYEGPTVAGKTVLVMEGDGDAHTPDDFYQQLAEKTRAAEKAGVRVLLVASASVPELLHDLGHYLTGPRMRLAGGEAGSGRDRRLQTIVISQGIAELMLAGSHISWKKLKRIAKGPARTVPVELTFTHQERTQELKASNVLGYIEGSDKKDELVIVTAHYDHIGKQDGEVYNGADDDGSGTVALLEIAEAFARARAEGHGPRRSILFMPVSGEEKGLLGSEWYSTHPVFPLRNTVADLNIDMIGRVDSTHRTGDPYVYIIGSDRLSTELHRISVEANATYTRLELDNTYNSPDDPNRFYYRSDHYNFAKHGIPVIFYFSGVHEDYHRPGDEVEKIRFDLLRARTTLVFHTAWELVEREERIVVDGKVE